MNDKMFRVLVMGAQFPSELPPPPPPPPDATPGEAGTTDAAGFADVQSSGPLCGGFPCEAPTQ